MRHYNIWLERYRNNSSELLGKLREYKGAIDSLQESVKEKNLIQPLTNGKKEFMESMCFVDGGEGMKELLGAAVYFIKGSGLVMKVKEGRQEIKFVRELDMNLLEYDDYTKERVELLRGMMEFDVAERCVREHSPDYVFLDGSLYVNFSKRPVDCDEYQLYRKKYVRLLKLCRDNRVHIVGVSEDSRSRLFISYLARKYQMKFPPFMTDSGVLRLISGNTTYRTIAFNHNSRFGAEDKNTLTVSFPTLYMQPTPLSNPLRIDVPDWEKDIEKIIDIIANLSRGSKHYGYPMPLYLAHLDAHIEQKQADWSTTQMIHFLSRNDPELYETILRERRRGFRPA